MKLFQRGVLSILALVLCSAVSPAKASAQPAKIPEAQLAGKELVTVVPGAGYEAGSLHTKIFGKRWRSLWTTPIEVPVLNLATFAGGLHPFETGGGGETMTLSFKGADGKEYRFRSLDKNPARALPPKLKSSVVADLLQDQTCSSNPVANLVVAPLMEATDIYHITPKLVVLPYDKAHLGEYYDEFAGLAGTIEERPIESESPGKGFMGADKISGTYALYNNLEKDNDNTLDSAAYLRARLMDLFIGDWDRHSDQWKWAGYKKDGKTRWLPIPRDRDQAFYHADGLYARIIAKAAPRMSAFGPNYPAIKNLSSLGHPLDRRLLSGISWPEWDAVTRDLEHRLTDKLIHEAVMQMPPAMYQKAGAELESDLRSRRDQLQKVSREFYLLCARDVDVFTSNKAEYARVERQADGGVDVAIFKRDAKSGAEKGKPFYHRLFTPLETEEVRLYLQGGDDRAVVQGPVSKGGVKVRVIGGEGEDSFEDTSQPALSASSSTLANMTFFYDDGDKSEFKGGQYTVVDRQKVVAPVDDQEKYDAVPRDAGRDMSIPFTVDYSPHYGFYAGTGVALVDYGFRALPYRYTMALTGGVATRNNYRYDLHYKGDFRTLLRNTSLTLEAGTTQLDLLNYYGLGNETYFRNRGLTEDDFEVLNQVTTLAASLRYPMDTPYSWSAGVKAKWINLTPSAGSFIERNRATVPGINHDFAGSFVVGFHYDSRDCGDVIALSAVKPKGPHGGGTAALGGIMADVEGSYYPPFFGNEKEFEKIRGEFRTYIPLVSSRYSRVAFRVGGEKIWGSYPFYEAAYLGGSNSLRGYDKQRFAGDASLYGGSELRLHLGEFKLFVPVMYGPLAFVESGRVFLSGENSSAWHSSVGGGLWFSFIESRYAASIAFAQGLDDGRLMNDYGIYIKAGFGF